MGKNDIETWVAQTNLMEEDYEESSRGWLSWQQALDSWPEFIANARKALLSSKTKLRILFVEDELIPLVKSIDLSLSQILEIFQLLTLTYPRYIDGNSREAIEKLGTELVRRDEERVEAGMEKLGILEQIVGWISVEVSRIGGLGTSRSSAAIANLYVLLCWCCGLYSASLTYNKAFTGSPSWSKLVDSIALLYNCVLDTPTRAKDSLRRSATVRTRAALRIAPEKLQNLIDHIFARSENHSSPSILAPLLSVAFDVLAHSLNGGKTELFKINRDKFVQYYTRAFLMSKVPVALNTSLTLQNVISDAVTNEDFATTLLPTMEKAVLRSPEIALPVISNFFLAYSFPLDKDQCKRVTTFLVNSAKSSNAVTRLGATSVFNVVMDRNNAQTNTDTVVTEILALPKAGKTANVEHRQVLYTMLGFVKPNDPTSKTIASAILPLLPKETNSTALEKLVSAWKPHLVHLLKSEQRIESDQLSYIASGLNSAKPELKHLFCHLVGSILWEFCDLPSDSVRMFAEALVGSLETNLKTIAASPLNSPAGPLEGYVAIATFLGPLSRYPDFDKLVINNAVIQSIRSTSSSKPSFLLWNKVYQKLKNVEEETWLARALDSAFPFLAADLVKDKQLRISMGQAFIFLACYSKHYKVRELIRTNLSRRNRLSPELVNAILRDAFPVHLAQMISPDNGSSTLHNKRELFEALLTCCVLFAESFEASKRHQLLAQLVLLGHHDDICGSSRHVWIELCQKASVDPHELIVSEREPLLHLIMKASLSEDALMAVASFNAVTTVSFVAPDIVLPPLMLQYSQDLDSSHFTSLSETDIAIWGAPEGTLYVDVLANKKPAVAEKKGKGAAIAKWENEVRSSLKQKGPSNAVLSKQDQALVDAQLKKESETRKMVNAVRDRARRGLRLIESIVASKTDQFKSGLSKTMELLIHGIIKHDSTLLGPDAYQAYLSLGKYCSDRLKPFEFWVGVGTLRCFNPSIVPPELHEERLNSLLLRVLYRLRILCEQTPFDGATYAFVSPLLSRVIGVGGVDLTPEDDQIEQITLSLDIIRFHAGEFSDTAFPRSQALNDLILAIKKYPSLGQEAASTLIELSQAIYETVTADEVNILIRSTLNQEVYVRNTCLQSLQPFDLTERDWSPELWIACYDNDEPNARLAGHIWEDNGLDIPEHFASELLSLLEHDNSYVRSSTANAIAAATEHWPGTFTATLGALKDLYRSKAIMLAPEFDQYGILISQSVDREDPWLARLAVAQTFESLAPLFQEDQIEPFFAFLIEEQSLGDRHSQVRRALLSAGSAVIDMHGSKKLQNLISMFEKYLSSSSNDRTETSDYIKEAVVILFGRVARHMPSADSRKPAVVNRLVEALKTPSEQVQIAVSDCIAPLVPSIKPVLSKLVEDLFHQLFSSPKYGERRGAAYGISGIIKGLGIVSIAELNVVQRLQVALEDKKRYEPRQGAMIAVETLSSTLDRNFEPYIIELLPLLLSSFGDSIPEVREATQDAAKVIMARLSGYGVKSILPSLLYGLDEKQWRTKKGSIELLGTMAFCAPRQLSVSLPTIIPRLTEVMTDSHTQVRGAANKSLKQFGEVINNPEIQFLVPVLLKAFVDPSKSSDALSALLDVSFTHYIDSPSLALIIPIIERGLKERSGDAKRKATQIVGNLASLTDSKDFVPYLSRLLPQVHVVLADTVPEARATAAKALGTLMERLGEAQFPDMVPGLLKTLKSDVSGIDRQGAAQGLSEVLAGLGMERLDALMPDIISNAQSPRSSVREGFMSLLVYLPATFGTRFQPYLPRIVTPILLGLSDTEETVRSASMRAGRMIITNYSNKAIDLMLPELERGMFDSSWRIRHSSITLVGELLFKVSGISGKVQTEDDEEAIEAVDVDAAVTETSRRALVETLGKDRRDQVFSALYIVRQDAVSTVRQASVNIWKALVHNTPRTVREVLPVLVSEIISLLTNPVVESQETAARTIGEMCRKSGERILGEIVSILRSNSESSDRRTREGVCLSLSLVMENSLDTQREANEDEIISMVRGFLVDDEPNVRAAAAQAFDSLQEHVGVKAIDQTIPTLLEALRQPGGSSGTALQALTEVMNVRANTVFPILIPTLIATPMSAFNARALATLVAVAGNALNKRLSTIVTALVRTLDSNPSDDIKEAVDEAIVALLSSVADLEGLNVLMLHLLGWAKSGDPSLRVKACQLFAIFCRESELDYSLYRIDWIRQLLTLLDDRVVAVHTASWEALNSFVTATPKDELEPLVVPLRRTIESMGAPGHVVPGLCLPKGVAPLVPIIIAGLTTGSHDQRENAAFAIGDVVLRTDESSIKLFVVPFTGPLIRVATQAMAYPPGVKAGIISALTTMLDRIPTFVKPFFPQLQRTFVKFVSDPASLAVRNKAAIALGSLMRSQPRVDPLITELIGTVHSSEEPIAASMMGALAQVVGSAGNNVGQKARESCVELIGDAFKEDHEEHYILATAQLFAALAVFPGLLQPLVTAHLLPGTPAVSLSSHMILAVLSYDESHESSSKDERRNLFQTLDVAQEIATKIQENVASDRSSVSRPAREARDILKLL